ncbi:MAG: squalene/phytoene synthase family protein [Sphingomonadaceae bacterium]
MNQAPDPGSAGALEIGVEIRLALAHAPRGMRSRFAALFALDAALAAVLARRGDAMIARIKLAWWREALEALDQRPPPPAPVLKAAAGELLPHGVSGAALAGMEEGWRMLLDEERLGSAALHRYARARGGRLFRHAAALLGERGTPPVEAAGAIWALADLARHGSGDEATDALAAARALAPDVPRQWPGPLRPLGMLAALGLRDARRGALALETPGAPARILRMIAMRVSGR